jgi:serine/threonine protein kinase
LQAQIHQSLPKHANIVSLHRVLDTPAFLLLVLEFVPGEDLFYFLEQARDHYEPSEGVDQQVSSLPTSSSECSVSSIETSRTPPTPSLLSNLSPTKLLSRTRLKLIASMFSQMCDAVATCHERGVFHRDIKPENFIVTDGMMEVREPRTVGEGEQQRTEVVVKKERRVVVKLTDFGLSTTEMHSSDMDCGSAPYMSFGMCSSFFFWVHQLDG